MARRSHTAKASPWWRLVLVPLPFVVALPFLLKPSFSLVDDGVSLDIAKRMDTNEMRVDDEGKPESRFWRVEVRNGRVRPAYWWWIWFNYKLYGTSAGGWFFGLTLSLIVLVQIVYELATRTTGSVLAGMLAGGLVAAFYPCHAVFSRLGLGETPQLLLLGVSLLCIGGVYSLGPRIARRDVPLSIVLFAVAVATLGVAYFVKETTLAMLPTSVVMVFALWRRQADTLSRALLVGYAAASLAAAIALLAQVVPLLGSGDYSRDYFYGQTAWGFWHKIGLSLLQIVRYLGSVRNAWFALPVLGLASLAVRCVRAWRGEGLEDSQRWSLAWFTFAVASLLLLAPWGGSTTVVNRYLMPFAMFGALVIAPEAAWLLTGVHRTLAERDKSGGKTEGRRVFLRAFWVSLIAVLGLVAVMNVVLAYTESAEAHRRVAADANLIRLIAEKAPADEPVFLNLVVEAEEETRYEIMLHLRLIHHRDDYTDTSIMTIGDADDPGVPDGYRKYVGQPRAGQWVVFPYGRYRRELVAEVRRAVQVLEPARAYAVTATGSEAVSDGASIDPRMQKDGYGWIVLVPGRSAGRERLREEQAP